MRVTSLAVRRVSLYAAGMQVTSLAIFLYAARVRLTLLPLNEPQFFVPLWITLVAREALQVYFVNVYLTLLKGKYTLKYQSINLKPNQ